MDICQYLAWQSEKIIEVEPGFQNHSCELKISKGVSEAGISDFDASKHRKTKHITTHISIKTADKVDTSVAIKFTKINKLLK